VKLLNGCAKSKYIADAFESLGWDAWTCDILPPEGGGKHIQDDVLNHLNDGWDMAIFHPDCTRLALSGVRWMYLSDGSIDLERYSCLVDDCQFFNSLLNADIPLIGVESPIHHHFARELIRTYDQIIQPHYFGDKESKAICLWLKGLTPLVRTHWIDKSEIKQSVWREAPGPNRKANRSRNFKGVSRAMAEQWGNEV